SLQMSLHHTALCSLISSPTASTLTAILQFASSLVFQASSAIRRSIGLPTKKIATSIFSLASPALFPATHNTPNSITLIYPTTTSAIHKRTTPLTADTRRGARHCVLG